MADALARYDERCEFCGEDTWPYPEPHYCQGMVDRDNRRKLVCAFRASFRQAYGEELSE